MPHEVKPKRGALAGRGRGTILAYGGSAGAGAGGGQVPSISALEASVGIAG